VTPSEKFAEIVGAMTDPGRAILDAYGIPPSLHRIFSVAAYNDGVIYVAVRRDADLEFESVVPDSAVRVGDIIDIVAFDPKRPAEWWQVYDTTDILGVAHLACANAGEKLWLSSTPLNWLRAGARGICLLDLDDINRRCVLRQFSAVVCESRAHGHQTERLCQFMDRPPRFFIPDYSSKRAA
jgi:hypothetical protein